ncbi:hypothetical protein [Larkinella rosea]|uniref:Uncharacterized protein n=1 Tax=Larkinella rosea TaxID=2025312 RepID=A0A3P1BQ84_9BACT|nr:hypothetical protein [Larkinella rosea]RRB02844.1 hypothetical protein EHT25_20615 [Larkinella rosea]
MPYTVIFTVNMASRKNNVTILKSVGCIICITDKTVVQGTGISYAKPARPTLSFRFEDGFSDLRKYIFEAVNMSPKKPGM